MGHHNSDYLNLVTEEPTPWSYPIPIPLGLTLPLLFLFWPLFLSSLATVTNYHLVVKQVNSPTIPEALSPEMNQ